MKELRLDKDYLHDDLNTELLMEFAEKSRAKFLANGLSCYSKHTIYDTGRTNKELFSCSDTGESYF